MTRTRLSMLLLLSALSKSNLVSSAANDDYYCGSTLDQAISDCLLACPTGEDSDCSGVLGQEYICFYFTGCAEKIADGFVPDVPDASTDLEAVEVVTDAPVASAETQSPTTKIVTPTTKPIEAETAPPTPPPMEIETQSPLPAPAAAPTNKPTKRVTSPPSTDAPTTFNPTTPKPTNPLSTPPPTSIYIQSLKTATRSELHGNAPTATSTSYGFLFTVRTTPESPVMQVVGFDFLTASTNDLNFELYSKAGIFAGFKGYYGRWEMIGRGTVKGKGIGGYTSIPSDLVDPMPVNGLGGARSFYLTLSTKDMIYRVAGTGAAADEAMQESSSELELYEGESVQAFPFPLEGTQGAYDGPGQFIGAIYYDALPCRPLEAYGVVNSLPCPAIPTVSPAPTTSAPITGAPTISRMPSLSPTVYLSPEPTYTPTTASPTISPPPTERPTEKPVPAQSTEVYLVLTLRNTANRNLTAPEEKEFKDELLAFFFLHSWDDVKVENVDVWYQQQVEWVEEVFERHRRLGVTELASTALTLILTVSHYGSHSESEIGETFVELLGEAEVQVVNLMRGREEYPFFFQVDAMRTRVIDAVTYSPVAAPRLASEGAVEETVIQTAEEPKDGNVGGVGAGVFALCLVTIGISYHLIKKRFHTKEEEIGLREKKISDRTVREDIETGLRTSKTSTSSTDKSSKEKKDTNIMKRKNDSHYRQSWNIEGGLNEDDSSDSSSDQQESENKGGNTNNAPSIDVGGVGGDSDSDSDSSTDSKLQAKIAERRLERAKSTMAVVSGKAYEEEEEDDVPIISSIDITIPENQGVDSHGGNLRRKRQNVSKSINVTPGQTKDPKKSSSELKKSMTHHRGDSDSDSESSSDSKLQAKIAERRLERAKSTMAVVSGKAYEEEEEDDVPIISSIDITMPKNQRGSPPYEVINETPLKKSMSMPQTIESHGGNLRRKRQNVSKSIKVTAGQTNKKSPSDLKKSMKHHRSKSLEIPSLDSSTPKEYATDLRRSETTDDNINNSHPDIKTAVSSDVRGGGRHNTRHRKGRSLSITRSTMNGIAGEAKKKARRPGSNLRQSSRHEGASNLRKSRRLSTEDSTKLSSRDSSGNLRQSSRLERAGDLRTSRRVSSEDLTKQSSSDSSCNLRQSSRLEGTSVLRKSRQLSSEDLTKLSSRYSSGNLRQSSRLEGAGNLRKSRRGSSNNVRRLSQDSANDLRKSKTQDSYDLKRSRTRDSTEDLRKSSRRDSAGDMRKSKRRSADDVTRSMSSSEDKFRHLSLRSN